MLNFIYIAEEKKDFELSGGGIIKVGYTKDVKRRSGQMKQAARRTLHEELNISITRGKPVITIDQHQIRAIEAFVIEMIQSLTNALPLSREFFVVSDKDKEYIKERLCDWVDCAMIVHGEE